MTRACPQRLILVAIYYYVPVFMVEKEPTYVAKWETVITTALPSDHKYMQHYLKMIEQNPIDIACDDGQNTVVMAAAGAAALNGGLVWEGRDANEVQPVLKFCNDVNFGTKLRHKVSSMCDLMLPPGSELWCARLDSRTSAQPCCRHHSLPALTRFRCRRSLKGQDGWTRPGGGKFKQYIDDHDPRRHERFQPEGFLPAEHDVVEAYQKVFYKQQRAFEHQEDTSGARHSSRRHAARTPAPEQPSPTISEPSEPLHAAAAEDLIGRSVRKYFHNCASQGWYNGKVTKSFTTMSWRPFAQQFAVTVSL